MSSELKSDRALDIYDDHCPEDEAERGRLIDKEREDTIDLEDGSADNDPTSPSSTSTSTSASAWHSAKLPFFIICLLILLLCSATICLDNLFVLIHPLRSPTPTFNSNLTISPQYDRSQWITLQPSASHQPIHYELLEPTSKHASGWTIVAIHGLASINGSDGFGMRNVLLSLDKELFGQVRFVIPYAPTMPIDVRGGQRTPAWFNIHNWKDPRDQEDRSHMQQSVGQLYEIVTSLQLDMSRTIFMGFSQGAVMSLLLSLNTVRPPAGVVMLSGVLPVPAELPRLASPSAVGLSSLIWIHGQSDPYFPIKGTKLSFGLLRRLSFFKSTTLESIPELGHGFDSRVLRIATHWLKRVMVKH
ncbi:hypothetical protein CROQUDRAFT_656084 [Cronartium quercuum f. sp. fusiforme G11]|uniref:Acyl-protein thioesterase 1 n=1 Tax=Cronartium quercuum f. sp. fusiforme G11 TaxID=708437 RepID=A0A9P6NNW6_9BASI|nr:hypothetical protein CROQUDRAFT_656084 [Cronartium quercuum f. sp. fusiforme G11]